MIYSIVIELKISVEKYNQVHCSKWWESYCCIRRICFVGCGEL
jgi:hypothetical protein